MAKKRSRRPGEVLQDSSTSELIFSIPTLVSYLGGAITLKPGESVRVEGAGVLENPVVSEDGHLAAIGGPSATSKSERRAVVYRDLDGRVAVVTRGAQGIGYAISERFVGAGARFVVAEKDEA